jgi:hypothetical protein
MIESRARITEIPKYALLLLLVWLWYSTVVIDNSYAQEPIEENIYVQVFFAFPPLGEPMLVQDVYLEFKNIPDNYPPINTSLEAFNDPFIKADFKGMGYYVNIDVHYLSSIQVEKAYAYADEIAQDFLRVFDFPDIQKTTKSHQIDENEVIIKQYFKCATPTAEEILMKYTPKEGFGKFIGNLVAKPRTDKSSLVDFYYTLQKNGSNFFWNFVIGYSMGKSLDGGTEETISLNELLNNSLPILASTHQSSIIIEIEKNRTSKIGDSILTYTLSLEDIHPSGYDIIDTEYYYVRKYEDLTTPLNNVIVKVKIGKIPSHNDYPWMAITIGIIGSIAVIVVACVKKRKTKKRNIKMRRKDNFLRPIPHFFCGPEGFAQGQASRTLYNLAVGEAKRRRKEIGKRSENKKIC